MDVENHLFVEENGLPRAILHFHVSSRVQVNGLNKASYSGSMRCSTSERVNVRATLQSLLAQLGHRSPVDIVTLSKSDTCWNAAFRGDQMKNQDGPIGQALWEKSIRMTSSHFTRDFRDLRCKAGVLFLKNFKGCSWNHKDSGNQT